VKEKENKLAEEEDPDVCAMPYFLLLRRVSLLTIPSFVITDKMKM